MTPTSSLKPLYPHQQVALDGLRASFLAGSRRPMMQLSTGAGKTVLACHIVTGAQSKGKRVAFTVPALGLIDQTFARFVENGLSPGQIGVLQGDHPWRRPHAPIQICSAQTLAVRGWPEVDVAVIDEAHIRHTVYERWMAECPNVLFIGLSATPWARGLGKLFDDLIKPTTMSELIDAGFLSKFVVFAPSHPDLTGVKTVAGDYHEGQLAERMDQPELVADVVNTWLGKARGLPTLCFATGRAHAKNLHDRFEAAGVRVAYIDANTPREERDQHGKDLASGKLEVITNIGTCTTGIDWDVRCISLCRPTKSDSLFVQIIGRGLRTARDKQNCLVLDHSDTHLRLGMVTDVEHRHIELDDGRKVDKSAKSKDATDPLPKECLACGCLVPAGQRDCPSCGVERPMPKFEEAKGELREFTGTGRMPPKTWKRQPGEAVADALKRMGEAAVWAQIRWVQEDRNRARGWAAHKFRELFDRWPPRSIENTRPQEPVALLLSWLRSRDIAWARSKANANTEGPT